ncbi:MAG: TonB-dependent receptor, partial [Sphingomonadales bacterium]
MSVNRVAQERRSSSGGQLSAYRPMGHRPAGQLSGIRPADSSWPPQPANDSDIIIVQGYKESLQSAAAAKREDNAIIEVIDAEGIADFPDLNLAEALQRVPGVAIDRDGGEARSITVRGLSPDFTRVRINGLEALATTGGKDQASGQGGANRGRGFDFQVFAAELFNRVTVRKSQAAEVEEGSLGATVDLETALPFDYPALAGAVSAEYGYNDLSRTNDPRLSGLISHTWADGRVGALLSVAYSSRRIREEGTNSGRWENPSVPTNSAGCFQSPGPCNMPGGTYSAVNSAWHARIPRYVRLDYDWTRLGVTGALQFRPSERGLITVSGLYADIGGTRHEDFLEAFMSRNIPQGMGAIDVLNPVINARNELVSATFNDIDIRSESRFDKLSTHFYQASVAFEQDIGDRVHLNGQIGQSRSVQDNPVQTFLSIDRYDVDGYTYDYSNPKRPNLTYPFDLSDPANWVFTGSSALGDSTTIRLRPNRTTNRISSGRLDARFEISPVLTLKAGVLAKRYEFDTSDRRRFVINGVTEGGVNLPPGVTIGDISHLVSGVGRGLSLPSGTPTSWLAPDIKKLTDLLGLDCNCINQFGDFR